MTQLERWDVFEHSLEGPSSGNPFIEQHITGRFQSEQEDVEVSGFYDGDGIYRVRFMPSYVGEYRYRIEASFLETPVEGRFTATAATAGNHGPVRVAQTYHFAYEDGTPYHPIGTTCYVWNHQHEDLWQQTLDSLAASAFNKIRFCVFPKHYDYNLNEPRSYPYEGQPMDSSVLTKANFHDYIGRPDGNAFDYTRFNPVHFQHLDRSILALRTLGIEADLIVMHPYDRWGFSLMTPEQDDLYWNYVVARYAAYRNVWWSLANEYDLMPQKSIADWERYADIIQARDPYRHLRSIHNCHHFYDHNRPWITHCSIQRQNPYLSGELTDEWRARYSKPVVLDEIAYEGNIQHGWGNISGEEMTRRFWETAMRGGYPGHGETYMHPSDILWWSHGGVLHGDSPARIRFLADILAETPGPGLAPWPQKRWDEIVATVDRPLSDSGYYMFYYSFMQPSFRDFHFDDQYDYRAEVIDTWDMTIEDAGTHRGRFRIALPGKTMMAVRIRRLDD